MKRRILSVLAVLTALLCVLPVAALASDGPVAATITRGGVQTQYETLQEALDAARDGDVIQLAAGELGAGALRQTEKSSNSAESGPMHLHRSLTDVTIRGAEGSEKTVIDGLDIATGHIYGEGTHPVNGEPLNGTANSYYSYWEISNLTLKTFTLQSLSISAPIPRLSARSTDLPSEIAAIRGTTRRSTTCATSCSMWATRPTR